ncbi:protein phosphatase 2C catalytic subunit [Coccomyxa subellipsoidea C-169]|uniref:protein-serine/threonine phosphatase n=1 Tax=Coccomyxa subellipsoidea (strain C-169) TaxID=574566 RepID=I0YV17_COCSC|nr:protein phosphatase 2C catalytic subunit [Coccomyxa subellipsoidea C-169]EIE22236.1 protein phosphatase 2C catalytic subunit [Coccomyxa subellipsoidea C-169]|eukprot:XP_005646780.1 protein phosphatase 2C catalytic subunit [Coccomyxa subellipsoidea C-169]
MTRLPTSVGVLKVFFLPKLRNDNKVSFGYSVLKGKRAGMEDFFYADFKDIQGKAGTVGLFGIFDGHGGPHAADFVRENLFDSLLSNAQFPSDVSLALGEAFVETDKRYLQAETGANRDDGCTAVTAVLLDHTVVVAHVGDSRAVLSRGGKAIALSEDHKPNRSDERSRIEAAGGVVVWAGTWRVGGVLAVSRAFGDRLLKRYVVATPDVREEKLTSQDETLILASDGLWDVLSNDEAVNLIKDIPDAEKAAKKLTDEAYGRGSNDNISCIVLRFRF